MQIGVGTNVFKEWFDDYISTIEALSAISIYSRQEFEDNIEAYASKLRTEMEKIISGKDSDESPLLSLSSSIILLLLVIVIFIFGYIHIIKR